MLFWTLKTSTTPAHIPSFLPYPPVLFAASLYDFVSVSNHLGYYALCSVSCLVQRVIVRTARGPQTRLARSLTASMSVTMN